MFSFNGRCTRPCSRNIPNGFSLMAIVPCARLTNRALPNCSVFRQQASTTPLPNQCYNSEKPTTTYVNPAEETGLRRNKVAKASSD